MYTSIEEITYSIPFGRFSVTVTVLALGRLDCFLILLLIYLLHRHPGGGNPLGFHRDLTTTPYAPTPQ